MAALKSVSVSNASRAAATTDMCSGIVEPPDRRPVAANPLPSTAAPLSLAATISGGLAPGAGRESAPRLLRVDGVWAAGAGDSTTPRDAEACADPRLRVRRCELPAVPREPRAEPDAVAPAVAEPALALRAERCDLAGRLLASPVGDTRFPPRDRVGVGGAESLLCSTRRFLVLPAALLPVVPAVAPAFTLERTLVPPSGDRKSVGGFRPLPGAFSFDLGPFSLSRLSDMMPGAGAATVPAAATASLVR